MKQNSKIDIVLPTRNRPRYLAEAIRSISQQTYSDWKLLVVDGGDVNETRKIISKIPANKVQIIELCAPAHLEGEQRIANARNAGMAAGESFYVAHIDDDNYFAPTHLEKLLAAIESDDSIEFAYSDSLRIDSYGKPASFQAGGPFSMARLLGENFIASDDVLHSRRLYNTVGPIREDLIFYADWEFWVRLALKTKVAHVPETLTLYREHTTQASCEYTRERHKEEFLKVRAIVNDMAEIKKKELIKGDRKGE